MLRSGGAFLERGKERKRWCGRGSEGLQLMRMSSGGRARRWCANTASAEESDMSLESKLVEAVRRYAPVFLRLTVGGTFLVSVADRFGFWGPSGTKNVAWGDFVHFTQYTGQLNPWAPAGLIPPLAWAATGAEVVLGVALILGLFTRWAALMSGILLLLFACGMRVGTGFKSALNASVFSAAAAAFALVLLGPGPWGLDGLRGSQDRSAA